ncbi:MAG: hypothetical protein DCC55_20705 [Chloroflexi bacterium]|nr:MAG: hypothetical protein DCC55_20705 [Chloroflexota bacterium]
MSYYLQQLPAQPLRRFYLALNGRRLVNLITLERLCLYGAMGILMVPLVLRSTLYIYTFDPFLFALYALWAARSLLSQHGRSTGVVAARKVSITPTEIAGVLLLSWCAIVTLTALNPQTSLMYFLLLLRGGLFYFYFRQNTGTVVSATDLRRIIVVLLIVQCIVAVVQFATNSRFGSLNDYFGDPVDHPNAYFQSSLGRIIRVVGTFHNPNLLGNWIILLGPFVYAALYYGAARRQIFYLILLSVSVAVLLFTFSRSGWFSFALAGAVVAIRLMSENLRRLLNVMRRFIRYGLILGLLLMVGVLILGQFVDTLSLTVLQDRFRSISGGGEWRLAYVELAFQLFVRAPLTGAGLGNFSEAITQGYGNVTVPAVLLTGFEYSTVHNLWLQFLAETGLVGVLLLTLAAVGTLWQLWQLPTKRMEHDPVYMTLAVWLLAGLCGFLVNVLFEAVFFHQSILILMFSMIGVMTGLHRYRRAVYNHLIRLIA